MVAVVTRTVTYLPIGIMPPRCRFVFLDKSYDLTTTLYIRPCIMHWTSILSMHTIMRAIFKTIYLRVLCTVKWSNWSVRGYHQLCTQPVYYTLRSIHTSWVVLQITHWILSRCAEWLLYQKQPIVITIVSTSHMHNNSISKSVYRCSTDK